MADRDDLIDTYLKALGIEIAALTNKPSVSTVFVGGGTPSRLSATQLNQLLHTVETGFRVLPGAEITIECNPDDINDASCSGMRELGINRISLGVQSFNDAKLNLLEREHSREQIFTAIETIKRYFENFSMDLIFATQDEELDDWLSDLDTAIELSPPHLSTYELTIEKGTQFWNRQMHGLLRVPNEDVRADLYEATIDRAVSAGYEHYEISSFAKPGFQCRHNLSYWSGADYLAFGAGAARFVDGVRETNHRSTTAYLKSVISGKSPVFEQECVSPATQVLERVAFGLRQLDGIDFAVIREEVAAISNQFTHVFEDAIERLQSTRLLEISSGDVCRLTRRGLLLYDSIASELLSLAD